MKSFFLYLTLFYLKTFSQNNLNISIDNTSFKYDENLSYTEFYISIPNNSLKYILTNENFVASIQMELSIFSDTNLVENKNWILQNTLQNQFMDDNSIVEICGFKLQSGNYFIQLNAIDLNRTENSFIKYDFSVPKFSNKTELSEIQTSVNISKIKIDEEKNSQFYKNSYIVTPNPTNLFGENLSNFYYYIEIYNLQPSNVYKTITSIENFLGKTTTSFETNKKFNSTNTLDIGNIDISTLQRGTYFFNFILLIDSLEIASTKKKFFVYNSKIEIDTTQLEKFQIVVDYQMFNEKEIDEVFSQMRYITTSEQKKTYSNLTEINSKKNFINNFWNNYEQNGSNLKKNYFERIDYANKKFSFGLKSKFPKLGYTTDRGKIYITYGNPDEMLIRSNMQFICPYQIWIYNSIQGGVMFYFVDEFDINSWKLVHSSAKGEVYDINWKNKIDIAEQNR